MKRQYDAFTDEELIEQLRDGDSAVMDFLMEKYKYLVRKKANAVFLLGGDTDDLVQEGMIGLFKAIRDFDATKQASFRGFAEMCVKRQIITAVKTAARLKHMPLNSYVSLSKPVYEDDTERTLVDMLAERKSVDPEEMFLRREKAEALEEKIAQKLSPLEQSVLSLYLSGMNYQEIAAGLGRSPKSIDNALQRLKRKLADAEKGS